MSVEQVKVPRAGESISEVTVNRWLKPDGAAVKVDDPLVELGTDKATQELPAPVGEILTDSVAAVSVGLLGGQEVLDLEYVEDRDAEVDLNLVMTGGGQFVEVQGTGEEATFTRKQLDGLLELGAAGVARITKAQKAALGKQWPF